MAGLIRSRRAGGGALAFDLYKLANANNPSGTAPNSDLTSVTANGALDEFVRFVINTPATATLPDGTGIQGCYVEWPLGGLGSNYPYLDQWSLNHILLYLQELEIPVDTYCAVAITAGGVGDIGNSGSLVGIQYNGGQKEPFHMINAGAGAGWTTSLSPTVLKDATMGVAYSITKATTRSGGEHYASPIHGGPNPDPNTNAQRTPQSGNFNVDGPFTHLALVVGKNGITGAASSTLTPSVRTLFKDLYDIKYSSMYAAYAFAGVTQSGAKRWAQIGDSNGNGNYADTTWGGTAVRSGWTYRYNGVNTANYEVATGPGAGLVPYAIEAAHAAGANSGNRYFLRRTSSGADIGWPGTVQAALEGIQADVIALGVGGPDVFLICYGANDSAAGGRFLTEYYNNVRWAINFIHARWPDCWIILERERTTDAVSYPMDPDIYDDQTALAAEYPFVLIADGTLSPQPALGDSIHWTADSGGGQDVMAQRALGLLSP